MCQGCGKPFEAMGTKWRPPAQGDSRSWKAALESHRREQAAAHAARSADLTRRGLASDNNEIARLQKLRRLSPAQRARLQVLLDAAHKSDVF
jgi:hypothetical protein